MLLTNWSLNRDWKYSSRGNDVEFGSLCRIVEINSNADSSGFVGSQFRNPWKIVHRHSRSQSFTSNFDIRQIFLRIQIVQSYLDRGHGGRKQMRFSCISIQHLQSEKKYILVLVIKNSMKMLHFFLHIFKDSGKMRKINVVFLYIFIYTAPAVLPLSFCSIILFLLKKQTLLKHLQLIQWQCRRNRK